MLKKCVGKSVEGEARSGFPRAAAVRGGTIQPVSGISRFSDIHDRVFAALNLKKPSQYYQLSLL